MLEFALILPLLLFIILGIFAFGHFMFVYSVTASASREAARYGAAVGLSENNQLRFEDCQAIRASAMRVGSFGGLTENNIKIYYYDETTSTPPADPIANTAHQIARCQDGSNNNLNTISYIGNNTVGLGDRIEVRLFVNYVPLVPFVNLPSFPVNSTSVRTILRNVTVGTAAPAGNPGGGGNPSLSDVTMTGSTFDTYLVGQDIVVDWTLTETDGDHDPTGVVTATVPLWDGGNHSTSNTCTLAVATSGTCTITGGADWAGSMNVVIAYPGDENFNGSTVTIPITVRYATSTTLTRVYSTPPPDPNNPPPSESLVFEPVTFRINVTRVPGYSVGTQVVSPQGTVNLYDAGNTLLGSVPVTLSSDWWVTDNTLEVSFSSPGVKVLHATFAPSVGGNGDLFYGSNSDNFNHTVTSTYYPVLVVTAPQTAVVNQQVNVVVSFTPASIQAGFPTGRVVITDITSGNVQEGTLSNGTVTIPMSMAMPDAQGRLHNLRASYLGDVNYYPDDENFNITVYKGSTKVRMTGPSPRPPSGQGQFVTFTYTVEAVSPAVALAGQPSGGTVTLTSNDGGTIRTCTGPAPSGSCSIRFMTTGNKSVTAAYDGLNDPNFNPSTPDASMDTVTQPVVACAVFTHSGFITASPGPYFYFDLVNADSSITVKSVEITWPNQVGTNVYLGQAHKIPITTAGQGTTPAFNCQNNGTNTCLWARGNQQNVVSPVCIGDATRCTSGVPVYAFFTSPQQQPHQNPIAANSHYRFLFTVLSAMANGQYTIRVNYDSTPASACTYVDYTSTR